MDESGASRPVGVIFPRIADDGSTAAPLRVGDIGFAVTGQVWSADGKRWQRDEGFAVQLRNRTVDFATQTTDHPARHTRRICKPVEDTQAPSWEHVVKMVDAASQTNKVEVKKTEARQSLKSFLYKVAGRI